MTGGVDAPSEPASSWDGHGTLYLVRETLAALVDDRRVADFCLGSRGGKGLLSVVLRPGLVPGVSLHRGEILFAPAYLGLVWEMHHGERHDIEEAIAEPDDLVGLLLDPVTLLLQHVRSHQGKPSSEPPAHKGFEISCLALRMLLRHSCVSDLLFGSDGQECSLQFQLANGFAGTDRKPPQDWVGLEFNDGTIDLSWFDRHGKYNIRSYRLPDDEQALLRLGTDPLGEVILAELDESVMAASHGIQGLLQTLKSSFHGVPDHS